MDETVLPRGLIEAYRDVRRVDGDHAPPVVLLDLSPALDETQRCPNCGGVRGQGALYAPTGEKCGPYHIGGSTATRGVYNPLRRKLVRYACPVCTDGTVRAALFARCGVANPDGVYHSVVWPFEGREAMVAAVDGAVSDWTTVGPSGWLTLVGPYGSGKTYLAQRAVVRCCAADLEAVYVLAHTLGQTIMQAIQEGRPAEQVIARYQQVPVLAIDQLDWLRQRTTSDNMTYVAESLINLLDERYRARHRLATILIVNKGWWEGPPDDFAPIRSRATEGIIAETNVPNVREWAGRALRGEAIL